jgi:polyketide biosynthesis enoyl-CoA hydratase PksH
MELTATALDTLRVRQEGEIGFIQIHRPEANNTINAAMVREFTDALDRFRASAKVVVVEGLPEMFCYGADFGAIQRDAEGGDPRPDDPGPLYDLWLRLATDPYVSIAHVRGKANAGGMGFVAACDLVLCDDKAVFSLSEILFGLLPACVMPFLIRRVGRSRANYMTLMSQPVAAKQALEWGLADACEENSENLLRRHLLRLRRLNRTAIARHKRYLGGLQGSLEDCRADALAANLEVFSDRDNLGKIARYVKTGKFPWEGD